MLKRAIVAAVAALLLVAVPAVAEPSAADRETARSLMQEGDAAAARKDYVAALEAFQGAHAIMQVPSTGMEVARTLVALKRLKEARQLAREVAAMPKKPGEPGAFTRARTEAAELAKSLEARVAKLEVVVQGAPAGSSVKVVIDGQPVSAGAAHELDPGDHTIEASAGGRKTAVEVVLREGETRRESLTLRPPERSHEVAPREKQKSSSKRTLGFVIGGIGVAGLATAGVTGLILLSRDSKIDENCPDKRCNAEGRELIDGSQPLLIVNAVAWGVGLVGLGVGTWLVLSSDGSEPSASTTAVGPTLLPGGAGVGLSRSF